MYTIQKPLLEKLLEYLGERGDFVFLDTSRPDEENHRSILFTEPLDRKVCRFGDDPVCYLRELQGHWKRDITWRAGSVMNSGPSSKPI
ncbi:hypothetical protein DGMP_07230 [Desulfomarina profundi]|uniref:Uncharacterized protein n=2 Tax=Desulfomarina profundi TaxID=2772557 RepID=A0A8D5FLU1_9BACT|nr:hypothetical protein DGMP_07230 [Desulfomarina profundi]